MFSQKAIILKFYTVIIIFLAVTVFGGCQKEPALSVGIVNSTFSEAGGQTTISIQSNTVWTVSLPESWCTATPLSGKGDAMLTVTVSSNNGYSPRSAIVTVRAETLTSTVTINQSQKDALILTNKIINVSSAGTTAEVELRSNITYDVVLPSDAPWILHGGTKALSTYTHLVTIAPNNDYDARTAKIIFKDRNSLLSDTLTINQLQKDAVFVDPESINLEDVGGSFNIETSSNVPFDILIPSDKTWVSHLESKGLVSGNHTFSVSANDNYDSRSSTIIFRQKGGTQADTVIVSQKPKTLIETDKQNLYVQKGGGIKILNITSNADYEIILEGGSGWISQSSGAPRSESTGNDTNQLVFNISQNNSGVERSAKIIAKYSQTADTVIVRQYIYPGYLVRAVAGENLDEMIPTDERGAIKDLRIEGALTTDDFRTYRESLRGVEKLDITLSSLPNNAIPAGAFKVSDAPSISLQEVIFPQNLGSIGTSAFDGCNSINDILLPENLTEIGAEAFKGCTSLPSVTIQASVNVIGNGAFAGCSSLYQVTSKITSPFAITNVFTGLPTGSTLIVPVGKLTQYTSLTGWGYSFFTTIYEEGSAPADVLSLSQTSLLSTGSGETFTATVTASGSWNIDSKPEWINVTPSTGTGTRVVTISFAPYSSTPVTRQGDVIFKLNGKTLTASLSASQYNFPYKDGDYVKVQSSTSGNGIDLVFLGDGYTIEDIGSGKFSTDLNNAVSHFFAIEPYKSYRSYFDVYIVYAFSQESGISDHLVTKNTKFSTRYNNPPPSTSMSTNDYLCFQYAAKAPLTSSLTETLVTVIANSSRYAGTAFLYSDGKAVAIAPVSDRPYPYDFRGVLQHEAGGHGFGKLADEYVTNSSSIPLSEQNSLRSWQNFGHFLNVDLTSNFSTILWKHFIGDSQYSYVGAYEGGYYYAYGVWRPESGSLMINNITYINAPGRELIVKRIKQLAGESYSFTDFKSRDVRETGVLTKSAGLPVEKDMLLPPPVLIRVD